MTRDGRDRPSDVAAGMPVRQRGDQIIGTQRHRGLFQAFPAGGGEVVAVPALAAAAGQAPVPGPRIALALPAPQQQYALPAFDDGDGGLGPHA